MASGAPPPAVPSSATSVVRFRRDGLEDTNSLQAIPHPADPRESGSVFCPGDCRDPEDYPRPQRRGVDKVPAGACARYTLDGSDPTDRSPMYTGPISMPDGGLIMRRRSRSRPARTASANNLTSAWSLAWRRRSGQILDCDSQDGAEGDPPQGDRQRSHSRSGTRGIVTELIPCRTISPWTWVKRSPSAGSHTPSPGPVGRRDHPAGAVRGEPGRERPGHCGRQRGLRQHRQQPPAAGREAQGADPGALLPADRAADRRTTTTSRRRRTCRCCEVARAIDRRTGGKTEPMCNRSPPRTCSFDCAYCAFCR